MHKFVILFAIISYCHLAIGANPKVGNGLNDECFNFLCGANCFERPNCCSHEKSSAYKGPFYIGKPYWIDGGRPTIPLDNPDRDGAFESCVCDYKCATDAITGYMVKYAGDCNQDGIINCEDYKHIHLNGYMACQRREIKEEDIKYDIDVRGGFDD